jgi:hypothetical protein
LRKNESIKEEDAFMLSANKSVATKATLLHALSDKKVEESVNESLSMMRFCDLDIEDSVPDHSVLSRFRSELTEKKAFDRLFKKINRQLVNHCILIISLGIFLAENLWKFLLFFILQSNFFCLNELYENWGTLYYPKEQ